MRSRPLIVPILVAFLALCAAGTAAAQTVLIVDTERDGETLLAGPLPVREGLADALYGLGLIVFDLPGDSTPATAAEVLRVARAAGADVVVKVDVSYQGTPGTTPRRVSARATWTATSASTGASVAGGSLDGTNADREKLVDRMQLGEELGGKIAAAVNTAVSTAAGASSGR
jgi:hypothetical protein